MPRFVLLFLSTSLALIIALGSAPALAASAQGQGLGAEGVVIGSFSDRDNAERRVRGLARDMAAIDVALTVLPDGSGLFRVVAQSQQMPSRRLLQRLRISGFADAWHISDSALLGTARIVSTPVAERAARLSKRQTKAEGAAPLNMDESVPQLESTFPRLRAVASKRFSTPRLVWICTN